VSVTLILSTGVVVGAAATALLGVCWCVFRVMPAALAAKVSQGGFGGLVVSMLASGTQDRGFIPGRSRWIFRAKKSSSCLPSEGK
jgi:hypothetical protein